jgi:protein-L-isoaspartate(D-aspartate) O-methyltransferase
MVVTDRTLDREAMVERQLKRRGIRDERVLDAFRTVPREAFVGPAVERAAYEDTPLPIGEGQTISQPYVVALMVEALEVRPTDRVLEVGAGSGYAAAILSRLAGRVYAVERNRRLAEGARDRLGRLGYDNIEIRVADGTLGWPEAAPFDAILVSAGGPGMPTPLLDQLAPGGRLVIPIGRPREQTLFRVTRVRGQGSRDEWLREDLGPVMFVPLIGQGGWPAIDREEGPPP